jgi:hypothetical protein
MLNIRAVKSLRLHRPMGNRRRISLPNWLGNCYTATLRYFGESCRELHIICLTTKSRNVAKAAAAINIRPMAKSRCHTVSRTRINIAPNCVTNPLDVCWLKCRLDWPRTARVIAVLGLTDLLGGSRQTGNLSYTWWNPVFTRCDFVAYGQGMQKTLQYFFM